MSFEDNELEELTGDIRRLIESNKAFLDRLNDDEYQADDDDEDGESLPELDDYEEL